MKRLLLPLILSFVLSCLPVQAEEVTPFLTGFTTLYTYEKEETFDDLYAYEGSDFAFLSAWRGETVYAKIYIQSITESDITVKADSFCSLDQKETIPVSYGYLNRVSANIGYGMNTGAPYVDVPDIVSRDTVKTFEADQTEYVLLEVSVPKDQPEGIYESEIQITEGSTQTILSLRLRVLSDCLEEEDSSILDLWQYPYSSYYRYSFLQEEEPFSQAHLKVLREELTNYVNAGGKSITCTIVNEAWAHQTYYDTPSLIQWNIDGNSNYWFDYTDFDAYVELCMDMGIDERIECFSFLPWTDDYLVYNDAGQETHISLPFASYEWYDAWTSFYYSFASHLLEKGWEDRVILMCDERGITNISTVTDLLAPIESDMGMHFQIGCAINAVYSEEVLDQVDYLAISITAMQDDLDSLILHRKENGQETVLYNCTGNYPNLFLISDPAESIWTLAYLTGKGMDGFLRWAYNAYNDEPQVTSDYRDFEAGDIYLVYPDEKDSSEPVTNNSYRLCMIEYAMEQITKYRMLSSSLSEEASAALQEVFSSISKEYGIYNSYGACTSRDDEQRRRIMDTVDHTIQAVSLSERIAALESEQENTDALMHALKLLSAKETE